MKMDGLNKWLTLGANIGVVAGIIFLGIELQQNNELLVQDSRYSMLQNQKDWGMYSSSTEEISSLLFLNASGHELTELDEVRRFNILTVNLLTWQWEWEQSKSGLFGGTRLPVEAFRAMWNRYALARDWAELKQALAPEFVIFMENEVAD